jgi:hypothetical protein
LTIGVRGAHLTMGRRGITRTVGLPGTGIYYTSHRGYHSGFHSAHSDSEVPLPPGEQAHADRKAEMIIGILTMVIIALIVMLFDALSK